jgi:hypothetical protein|tara:strand:- start:106 stop:330 length:225 start_codon:yes stop_codon:yes gene_type:complete
MHHELAELPLILSSFGMSVTSDGLLMCLPEYIGRSLGIAPHVESQGRLDVFVPHQFHEDLRHYPCGPSGTKGAA